MATLALQEAAGGLGNVNLVAASAGGDQVPTGIRAGGWDLAISVVVRNGGASSITLTPAGQSPVSVPAGATGIVPIVASKDYGALRSISYSAVTSVTVGAVRLSPPP